MTIHTIGDSHSKFGWEKIKDICVHHIGPKTCFSVGRDNLFMVGGSVPLENKNRWISIKENDIVLFCFGEIDCRCHVGKHISNTRSYQSIIDEMIDKYFVTLQTNQRWFNSIKVAVYNVPPPCKQYDQEENEVYKFIGTDETRKSYHEYFNKSLKLKCMEYEYYFFDVYQKYKDDQGFLKKELSDGGVHINDPIYLIEELDKMNKFFGVVA